MLDYIISDLYIYITIYQHDTDVSSEKWEHNLSQNKRFCVWISPNETYNFYFRMLPNFADNLTHQVQSPFTYTPLHFPAVTFHHPTISDNDYRSINNPDETCGLRVRSDWWTSTGQPRGIPRFPLHVQISKKKKFETSQFVKKFCFQQPHVRSFLTDKYQHTWFYTKTYGFKSCRVLKLHPPAVSKRDLVFSTLVNVTSLPPPPAPNFPSVQ